MISRRRVFLCLISLVIVLAALAVPELRTTGGNAVSPAEALLVAVGDTLVHTPEINAAWDPAAKTHDFRPMFAWVQPILSQADLAVAVLETNLGGPETGYTGYPRFNSPYKIADALQWAGIDVVFTAHNHMLDKGRTGLNRTIEYLDQIGLAHVGSARTADPAARMVIREAGGIRLAFLAYTTSTNGLPVPSSAPWSVNLYTRAHVEADAAAARRAGAEIVIAALHCGTEYQRRPDAEQRRVVSEMAAAGVDIILGSHPHTVQPVEFRNTNHGRVFIAYSLGNFLSNQRKRYSDCGLMLLIMLRREANGLARIAGVTCRPFWVHRYRIDGRLRYRILPLNGPNGAPYIDDPLLTADDRRRLAEVWEETASLLGPEWFK